MLIYFRFLKSSKRIIYVKLAAANFRFQSAASPASGIYSHCNFLNYILLIQGCQSSALISFLKLPRHPRSCLRNCWLQHRQPEGRAVSLSPSSQSRCCHLNAAVVELFPCFPGISNRLPCLIKIYLCL